jgi:hypothetical protein
MLPGVVIFVLHITCLYEVTFCGTQPEKSKKMKGIYFSIDIGNGRAETLDKNPKTIAPFTIVSLSPLRNLLLYM